MFGWGFSQPCLITGGYCMIYFVLMDCFLPEWLHHLNLPHVFIGIFIIGNWWDVATGHLIFPQIEIIGHWIEIIGHWNAVEKQLLPPLSQHVPTYFNYFSCFPTIVQLVPAIISSPTIVHHPFRFQHCSSTSYDFPTIFPLVPPFSPSFFKLPIIFPFSRVFPAFSQVFPAFSQVLPRFSPWCSSLSVSESLEQNPRRRWRAWSCRSCASREQCCSSGWNCGEATPRRPLLMGSSWLIS